MLVFHYIMGISNQNAASLYNPLLDSQNIKGEDFTLSMLIIILKPVTKVHKCWITLLSFLLFFFSFFSFPSFSFSFFHLLHLYLLLVHFFLFPLILIPSYPFFFSLSNSIFPFPSFSFFSLIPFLLSISLSFPSPSSSFPFFLLFSSFSNSICPFPYFPSFFFLIVSSKCFSICFISLVAAICDKTYEFLCLEGTACLYISQVCDGVFDCPDKSDEFNCSSM